MKNQMCLLLTIQLTMISSVAHANPFMPKSVDGFMPHVQLQRGLGQNHADPIIAPMNDFKKTKATGDLSHNQSKKNELEIKKEWYGQSILISDLITIAMPLLIDFDAIALSFANYIITPLVIHAIQDGEQSRLNASLRSFFIRAAPIALTTIVLLSQGDLEATAYTMIISVPVAMLIDVASAHKYIYVNSDAKGVGAKWQSASQLNASALEVPQPLPSL